MKMICILRIFFCLFLVPKLGITFNVNPIPWKTFGVSPNTAFGYKVIQLDERRLLVSDPLMRYNEKYRGRIYRCETGNSACSEVSMTVPGYAVNMSLGLSMVKDPASSNTLACGPTIPRDCSSITTYNGMCFQLNGQLVPGSGIPSSLKDCPVSDTDIVFLIDGSGSVSAGDFDRMKMFMKNLITQFLGRNSLFAIMQYSSQFDIEMDFSAFRTSDWSRRIDRIRQQRGWTHTPTAIRKVVNELFVPYRGARPDAVKVLLVITDGKTEGDYTPLSVVVNEAERKGIIRYAIGVGNAFQDARGRQELTTIASLPTVDHLFRVNDFQALDNLRGTLEKSIFSVEGTSSGESFKMELGQEGFSSAFMPTGKVLLGAVGAFNWKGSYVMGEDVFDSSVSVENDSYTGYSMAVPLFHGKKEQNIVILGAPRYQHKGGVMIMSNKRVHKILEGTQIGSYFGAEVCVVDLNSDSSSDLLLISAPMYINTDRDSEGQVTVCSLQDALRVGASCTEPPLMGEAGMKGRFGAALAALADLNGDGLAEVAVGAPLENDGKGGLYIFSGVETGINPTYSQRIPGSTIVPGLKYFGQSISGTMDQSGDMLPDLAVGSSGKVLLLRTRPVVLVTVRMTYSPRTIPADNPDCSKHLSYTARVCFSMMNRTRGQSGNLEAQLNYTLTLDAFRSASRSRAFFAPSQPSLSRMLTIIGTSQDKCENHQFSIQACPEDALNPLQNQVMFSFTDTPSQQNLSPVLHPASQVSSSHPLDFEIDCGPDKVCIDDLKVDFSFQSVSEMHVGIISELNILVSMENRGENSYNTHIIFTYPIGMSYRKVEVQDASSRTRVQCNALPFVGDTTVEQISCSINRPIFHSKVQASFVLSFGINGNSHFNTNITFTANATSGNEQHTGNENFKRRSLGVKYLVYFQVTSSEESTTYINFTAGKSDLKQPVLHSFKVMNHFRNPEVTVTIKSPIKLGAKDIWTNRSSLQIPGCQNQKDENPNVANFVEILKKTQIVNCTVAVCAVIKCMVPMQELQDTFYNISGEVKSGWIEQTQLMAVDLVSSLVLDYDRNQFVSATTDHIPSAEVRTHVVIHIEPNYTKEIIGGVAGGLLLLALITAALYKAGFFKSKYSQMMQETGNDETAGASPDAPPAAE
ncbi:integrin alpha-M-like isoform X2 [Brienomyrus brachyistius]|uniref:integrin alpha-M-like isoform X2 n=1 Tax=Brienomyrus brachyistius TaxID=42636 RepID=UPI0020B45992|nr:integrin alpha-M-like isoform X2 [Brienomyrus brachyistius]